MLKQIIFTLVFLGIAVNAQVTQQEIASVNEALKTAIAIQNQCITSDDCTTLAVGAQACGGPSSYVAYAVQSSNSEDIYSLAATLTKLETQYNLENSIMSFCSIVMPPNVVCDQYKKCSTAPAIDPVPL